MQAGELLAKGEVIESEVCTGCPRQVVIRTLCFQTLATKWR